MHTAHGREDTEATSVTVHGRRRRPRRVVADVAIRLFRLLVTAASLWPVAASADQGPLFSGHGPVFGLTTPTNADAAWAIDLGFMGRKGDADDGAMIRTMISYGVTEDVQVSWSMPLVFSSAPLAPARMTGMMPGNGDVEAIGAWRFHRQGTGVGSRFESTAYAGVVIPGPQRPALPSRDLRRALGTYTAVSTGIASRSHYVWVGAGYTRFLEARGDRRPSVFAYTAVWGYRPPPLQKEYPHWDWRLFVEMTGERSGGLRRGGVARPGSGSHQIFVGPATLGLYKNYAIEGGIQLPVYRDVGAVFQRERFRFAVNFTYYP